MKASIKPAGKRPTLRDVATAAGVGVATVDRVLNRRAPVKEDTARRVLDATQVLGFHAASLVRKRLDEAIVERSLGFLLQRGSQSFYGALGEALARATRTSPAILGRPVVEYLDDIAPAGVRDALLRLAGRVDALAIVAADHPKVVEAVETIERGGKPVFTLLSDITSPARAGFFGIDHRKAGRTAAWAISRLARTGAVAIIIGSHRYLGHELSESGFRSYFREHAPQFRLLEPMMSLEDVRIARETTLGLLDRVKDLAGIYVAGGGMEGVIEACREHGRCAEVVVVCNELIPETRAALIDGVVDLVIATPIDLLTERTVSAMADALNNRRGGPAGFASTLPFSLFTSENL